MSALGDVLDALARAAIPHAHESARARVGDIVLYPHQVAAVRQVEVAIDEFGGALLADAPGLGKTFVALAVASRYPRRIVAAPAALSAMWRDASARTRVAVEFVSLEALSRGHTPAPSPFLIVDEAHRASSTSARRYGFLAALAHHARVLLVTATPVRNRRDELVALLALFLGPEAETADEATIARCTVCRPSVAATKAMPRVVHAREARPRGGTEIADALRALPPPIALADGDPAAGLVAMSLARCWASSLAALDRAIWRRLQRGTAIADALDAGRLPTRSELAAWVVGDDAMQLAFPFMASATDAANLSPLRDSLAKHMTALRAMRATVHGSLRSDTAWRAARIRRLRRENAVAVAIAFTTFEETASALFSALRGEPGVVLLTGNGARSAAGPIDRADVLAALANAPAESPRTPLNDVGLVIATDLLAEGVNLQRASVIIHLDDPWTPAAVTQRVGRSARLGAMHGEVIVFRFAPPRAADDLLRIPQRHREKRLVGARALEAGAAAERSRQQVTAWLKPDATRAHAAVAATLASMHGLLARLDDGASTRLVGGIERGPRHWHVTDDPVRIGRLIAGVTAQTAAHPTRDEVVAASRAVLRWAARKAGGDRAGTDAKPSIARRRIASRLDALVMNTGPTKRHAIAQRVTRARALLGTARGAGLELRFAALLARSANGDEWIDEVERQLNAANRGAPRPRGNAELVALLILRRRPSIPRSARAPSRAPPAAWPETAEPR